MALGYCGGRCRVDSTQLWNNAGSLAQYMSLAMAFIGAWQLRPVCCAYKHLLPWRRSCPWDGPTEVALFHGKLHICLAAALRAQRGPLPVRDLLSRRVDGPHRVDREARPSTPTSVRPHDLVTVAEPTCAQATIYARDQDRVKTGDPLCNRSGKVAHAPGAVATEYGGLAWCVVVQHVDAVYGPIA
jgi:hypothetical protein